MTRKAMVTKAGQKLLKGARAAVKISDIIDRLDLVDKPGVITVLVTKKGKKLGVIYGMGPNDGMPSPLDLPRPGRWRSV